MPINADPQISENEIHVDNGYDKQRQSLPPESRIEFKIGDKKIIVSINDNGNLDIQGLLINLAIIPISANNLQIQL